MQSTFCPIHSQVTFFPLELPRPGVLDPGVDGGFAITSHTWPTRRYVVAVGGVGCGTLAMRRTASDEDDRGEQGGRPRAGQHGWGWSKPLGGRTLETAHPGSGR